MLRSVKMEKRGCPHCDNLDALFSRVRRIELFMAVIAGAILADAGFSVWSKLVKLI